MPARVTTSSLQYLEEPGSVALVPAQAGSSSRAREDVHGARLAWQVHGRAAKPGRCRPDPDPVLVAGPAGVQAVPASGPHEIPGIHDVPIHIRAMQGVRGVLMQASFLRRYHPGIHVPSRLLASMILDDEQTLIRNEDDGADLIKCTTTTLAPENTSSLLVVCVGGTNRDELCTWNAHAVVSELRSDGCIYTSGNAAWKSRGPIVQVQSTTHHTLLVRTRMATVVGDVRRAEGEREGVPTFRFRPTTKLAHTATACADACLASETCVYTADTRGIVQVWDVASNKPYVLH